MRQHLALAVAAVGAGVVTVLVFALYAVLTDEPESPRPNSGGFGSDGPRPIP
jgi:hypothetical protein